MKRWNRILYERSLPVMLLSLGGCVSPEPAMLSGSKVPADPYAIFRFEGAPPGGLIVGTEYFGTFEVCAKRVKDLRLSEGLHSSGDGEVMLMDTAVCREFLGGGKYQDHKVE
jgi:hypothetical protein